MDSGKTCQLETCKPCLPRTDTSTFIYDQAIDNIDQMYSFKSHSIVLLYSHEFKTICLLFLKETIFGAIYELCKEKGVGLSGTQRKVERTTLKFK